VTKNRGALAYFFPGSTLALCVLLLCDAVNAQHHCSAEVKLLVSPQQIQQALATFRVGKPSYGQIYLYDSENLDLLSQGLILRLRTGVKGDLTVKVRSSEVENCRCSVYRVKAGKCEVDFVGSQVFTSYSISEAWKRAEDVDSGPQLHSVLGTEQVQVLLASGISVDWRQITPRAKIQATTWDAHPDGPLKKVTIELWEWPGGRILELSAKAKSQNGADAMKILRQMAEGHALNVEKNQVTKTAFVLRNASL